MLAPRFTPMSKTGGSALTEQTAVAVMPLRPSAPPTVIRQTEEDRRRMPALKLLVSTEEGSCRAVPCMVHLSLRIQGSASGWLPLQHQKRCSAPDRSAPSPIV